MTCLWDLPEVPETMVDWHTLPEDIKDTARQLASRTVERLTGNRVGVCPITLRPGARVLHSVNFDSYTGGFAPTNWSGTWSNGCITVNSPCEVALPAPIGRIDELKANGVVIDPADYRIDNGYIVVYTGSADCPFPVSQNIALPDTEAGTMSVTYVNAYLPETAGLAACFVLAREYALALTGARCRLPAGVTSVVRQGITMTLESGSFPGGKTGIAEVDAYVSLWNPKGIVAPQVWSPDLPQHRRVGG